VPVTWRDGVEEILSADLTAALGYATPAGGAGKTLLLFFNGLQAKQGVRKARKPGALPPLAQQQQRQPTGVRSRKGRL
jgi:hypothetical protein